MSRYEELIPSHAEQTARGLKPKGRCPKCGRELSLRLDHTVAGHNRPDRQGRTSKEICTKEPVRSMNLAMDRVSVDFTPVEAKLVRASIRFMLSQSIELDADRTSILRGILKKMTDPANIRHLSRTEEWQVLAEFEPEKEPTS